MLKKYYTICIALSLSLIVPINIAENSDELYGPMNSPWPMKCYDQYHSSQSPYNTADNNGVIQWEYNTSGWLYAGIVIDNEDVLYFGDGEGDLFALNPDGSLKWKFDAGWDIRSTPALAADGTIYFTSVNNWFYAISSDGSLKWRFDAEDPMFSSPVIDDNGIIYFGNHGLHALYPDGTEYWNYPVGNTYCDPAIGSDGSVYIGSTNSYFYALNPNGTLQWKFKTGGEIHSHPSIGPDGTIYFGSNDEYIYALYSNGTLKWRYKINAPLYGHAAIAKDGTIYCSGMDLYAFNPNGSLKWQFNFGDSSLGVGHSSPAISNDGIIYVGVTKQGSNGGYIFAVNSDGTERWQREITTYFTRASPAIGRDGTVYIGSTWHESTSGDFYGIMYAFGKGNNQPDKPTINGPTSGKIDTSQTYTIVSSDQDNEQLYYYIDWGDGSNTGWKGPYNSGQTTSESHIWTSQGSYTIKAKAKDEQGLESEWSTLRVTMPKGKNLNYAFRTFLENHPIIYQLLSKITTNIQ